jgi:hypothetical protein
VQAVAGDFTKSTEFGHIAIIRSGSAPEVSSLLQTFSDTVISEVPHTKVSVYCRL